jgi:hypothetical protein
MDNIGATWADIEDVSKLLEATFRMVLKLEDVDQFLMDQTRKSLKYWCPTKINSTRRMTVVNGVLFSVLYFFLAIWAGSKNGWQV